MMRVSDALRVLADRGKLVCVISHDYELLAASCERVLRMADGAVVKELLIDSGSEEALLDLVLT
jgi:energy-coupling factor transport system ATP-binding protein